MEQLEKEWIEYPVIHFDMSGGKYMSDDQLQRYLIDLVEEQERKFGFHNNKIDVNLRLKDLIMALFQTTGKKVVVVGGGALWRVAGGWLAGAVVGHPLATEDRQTLRAVGRLYGARQRGAGFQPACAEGGF